MPTTGTVHFQWFTFLLWHFGLNLKYVYHIGIHPFSKFSSFMKLVFQCFFYCYCNTFVITCIVYFTLFCDTWLLLGLTFESEIIVTEKITQGDTCFLHKPNRHFRYNIKTRNKYPKWNPGFRVLIYMDSIPSLFGKLVLHNLTNLASSWHCFIL